jgi:uncharacterized phage protein (TIGR01671 family)
VVHHIRSILGTSNDWYSDMGRGESVREIMIRYIFKHVDTGNIEKKIYTLSQLEVKNTKDLAPCFNVGYGYELLGRDEYSGLKDKNGKEIYEGDICKNDNIFYQIIWIDRLAKYCAKVIKSEYVIVRDMPFALQQYVIDGTLECKLEIIGNIYENQYLIKKAE